MSYSVQYYWPTKAFSVNNNNNKKNRKRKLEQIDASAYRFKHRVHLGNEMGRRSFLKSNKINICALNRKYRSRCVSI